MRIAFFIALFLTIPVFANAQTTWYVPDDFPTIQQAISDPLVVNGDTVIVRPGTYVENINFLGKAVTVKSEQGVDVTIVDGNQSGPVITFNHGEDNNSVLQGFTLRNGSGLYYDSPASAPAYHGGGIFCLWSSPTIVGNKITGNTARGGGIYCGTSASAVIEENTITGNTGDYRGGGIFCDDASAEIRNNLISLNTADYGGGIHSFYFSEDIIEFNTIEANMSTHSGGGIFCDLYALPCIRHNTISGNSYHWWGGGIGCWRYADATIENNVIIGNYQTLVGAAGGGGIWFGLAQPIITNNRIEANQGNDGGGIYCRFGNQEIRGNTITKNVAESWGGGICFDENNTIFTGNLVHQNISKWNGGGMACIRDSTPKIMSNRITDNTAMDDGGGMVCFYNVNPLMVNNTLVGNSANDGGGVACTYNGSPTIVNSILWGNTCSNSGPEIYIADSQIGPSTVTISYCNIEGGQALVYVDPGCTLNWGSGMIDADPLFVVGPNGFHYLSQIAAGQSMDSPCINAGSDLASNLGMDTFWTRTDSVPDLGVVDMGFHYGPFSADWTVPLYSDTYLIPENTGGIANFTFTAGEDNANRNYILLGSVTGTDPGTPLPGGLVTLPINWDVFTDFVVSLINTPLFLNFMSTLDATGIASAQLNAPPVPGFAGITMHYAYALNNPWDFASNPVAIEIVP